MLLVRAAHAGTPVPKERSRASIGLVPVRVPDTHYYRRAIADGDLLLVEVDQAAPAEAAPAAPQEG